MPGREQRGGSGGILWHVRACGSETGGKNLSTETVQQYVRMVQPSAFHHVAGISSVSALPALDGVEKSL